MGRALRGMQRGRRWLATSLALSCAACVSVKPIDISPQSTAAAFRARSLDDEGLRNFAMRRSGALSWPLDRWDAEMLSLAALYFNPPLEVARARFQAAQAAITTAGEMPNPTLSVGPQHVANAMAGVPAWVIASTLLQIIETAGKRDLRRMHARYLAEAVRLELINIGWDTIGAVNSALLDMAAAQRRLSALESQVDAQSALVEIAQRRLRAGLGSSLELAAARGALNRSLLDREASRSLLSEGHHQLGQVIGVSAETIPFERLDLAPRDSAPSPEFLGAIRREAVLNRADLLAKVASYAAQETTLQLELARQYPDIEIGPGYEYDQGAHKWGVSVSVPIPVFNQNQGAIGEAIAHRRQAANEVFSVQARVIGEVDRAIAAYDSAARAFGAADELARRQRGEFAAKERLLERGEIDRLELLSGRVELTTAELAKADAEASLAKARLAIEVASQRMIDGFDPVPFILDRTR